MNEVKQIKLLGYVTISGTIKCVTGIHIGGSADSIDKGGIDSPVIKNPVSNQPYIPGSSLRGRMRSILEKAYGLHLDKLVSDIHLHHWQEDNRESKMICRTFGGFPSEEKSGEKVKKDGTIPANLMVRDCLLTEHSRAIYMHKKLPITEAKMETAIDRITSAAHPRTIERVPSGAEFEFEMIYKVQTNCKGEYTEEDNNNLRSDLENLLWVLEIIEKKDGLGGHSARGYGQVKFEISNVSPTQIDLSTKRLNGDSTEQEKDYLFWREEIKKISFPEQAAGKDIAKENQNQTENEVGTDKDGVTEVTEGDNQS